MNSYIAEPPVSTILHNRFRPVVVKELIHQVLMEALNEKQYSSEQAKLWSSAISDDIKTRLKGKSLGVPHSKKAGSGDCFDLRTTSA